MVLGGAIAAPMVVKADALMTIRGQKLISKFTPFEPAQFYWGPPPKELGIIDRIQELGEQVVAREWPELDTHLRDNISPSAVRNAMIARAEFCPDAASTIEELTCAIRLQKASYYFGRSEQDDRSASDLYNKLSKESLNTP